MSPLFFAFSFEFVDLFDKVINVLTTHRNNQTICPASIWSHYIQFPLSPVDIEPLTVENFPILTELNSNKSFHGDVELEMVVDGRKK